MTEANQSPEIVANVDPTVTFTDFKFRFKKDKMDNQRPTVELKLPVPNAQGIIEILKAGGKQLDLLLEVVSDTVRSAAGSFVADDERISQDTFPLDKISWLAIATAPRAERKTIAPELWEAFAKDYLEIMPGVTNKKPEAIALAVEVYQKKFSIVKTNKEILGKLKDQLSMYVEHTKSGDQFAEILELLLGKLDTYLKANDVELLAANL